MGDTSDQANRIASEACAMRHFDWHKEHSSSCLLCADIVDALRRYGDERLKEAARLQESEAGASLAAAMHAASIATSAALEREATECERHAAALRALKEGCA